MAREFETDDSVIDLLLSAADRGDQRVLAKQKYGLATSLYRAKVETAVEKGFLYFCRHLNLLIGASESHPSLSEIVDGLAEMTSIHSIRLPANLEGLRTLSSTISRAHEFSEGTEFAKRMDMGADILVLTILGNFAKKIPTGETPTQILKPTSRALRGLEHLALVDSSTLRELLTRVQIGSSISMSGVGTLCGLASKKILDTAMNDPVFQSDQAVKQLIIPTQTQLAYVEEFIARSENARLNKTVEDEQENQQRAGNLMPLFASVADEFLSEHGETPQSSQFAAFVLTEAMFAHGIHWTGTQKNIVDLCQYLVLKGYEQTAGEVLLQARRSGIFRPDPHELEKIYNDSGVSISLINAHQAAINQEQKLAHFHSDPYNAIPRGTDKAGLFLGKECAPQKGHRGVVTAGMIVLNNWRNTESQIPILVSINKKDAEGKVIQPSFDTRRRLVMRNNQGLSHLGLRVTSIDSVRDIGNLPPKERMREFVHLSKRPLSGTRICGYDRWLLTPTDSHSADPVIIGLRETNLRKIINDPEELGRLRSTLKDQEVILVCLQGTSAISSTVCLNLARSYIGTEREAPLHKLQSYVHPDNVQGIIAAAMQIEN